MTTSSERRFSVEYMRECFEYRDGVLYWKIRPAHHFKNEAVHMTFVKKSAGKPAGRDDSRGYLSVKMRIDGKPYCITAHRIIWALHHGEWPKYTIDHIDRNRKNNRIENLRDVPMAENNQNKGNPNGTGISGIHRTQGGKFAAQIRIGGEYIHLGTFPDLEAAHRARIMAESAALMAINKQDAARVIPLSVREAA